jgi:cell division protease FtsH
MVDMIKEDVFNVIPITREERIKRLSEAVQTLKTEFVGLDTIIDEISESISSWYITPEIISRPVVISLWGMTGTGKSSVVRRLTQLLGLKNSTMFFDCGEYIADSKDISTNICETFGFDTDD